MSNFTEQIKTLESGSFSTYEIQKGNRPVILTSAHGIAQRKRNGKYKLNEPFTRAIAKYVARKTNSYCLIKNADTGIDPNKQNSDEFKAILSNLIEKNHIKILLDIHGAKKEHDFDIEIGTLDGKLAKQATVNQLVTSLNKYGITKITINDPFKGGQISQSTHTSTGIECIQLEINNNYRNLRKIHNLRKICKALISFVSEK